MVSVVKMVSMEIFGTNGLNAGFGVNGFHGGNGGNEGGGRSVHFASAASAAATAADDSLATMKTVISCMVSCHLPHLCLGLSCHFCVPCGFDNFLPAIIFLNWPFACFPLSRFLILVDAFLSHRLLLTLITI